MKKTLLNARVNLVFYFLTLILSFFSRKVFLDCLGADFIGLTGTLQNLLGFLNLAELGIGSAIGYVLYKPIYDHDRGKINEIISVMGYLYRWIGLIILGCGCVLALFLPLIFPGTPFEMGVIYFAYFSFLASSLIGYFINYRQNLLGADQRNYVVTAYYQTMTIVKTLIQMASAHYTGSYYLWVTIELFFGIIYSVILNWKIRQTYPWLRSEIRQGRLLFRKYPEVMRYTRQLFVHKIAGFVQNQITPFLIYSFVSLKIVAFYGNYSIITDKLGLLLSNFLDSTGAGVGNLIAEGNKVKALGVFKELLCIRFLIAGSFIVTLYCMLPSFITLWLGAEYLLSQYVLIIICVTLFISIVRGVADQFLFGFGLFYDTWAPAVESALFITVAIVGGSLWGLEGLLLGGIVSKFIIIGIWKPYFLFSKGFGLSVWKYWFVYLRNGLFVIVPFVFVLLLEERQNPIVSDWMDWILCAVVIFTGYAVCCYALFLAGSSEMRCFTMRFIKKRSIL